MNLTSILLPLVVGIIGACLGYYFGKRSFKAGADLSAWKQKYGDLEVEFAKYKAKNKSVIASAAPKGAGVSPFNPDLAKQILGKQIVKNDLKVIEGIGPKISEILKASGIDTWQKLADSTADDCKMILLDEGNRYKMHNPTTWPQQAHLAYRGNWEELKRWHTELETELV